MGCGGQNTSDHPVNLEPDFEPLKTNQPARSKNLFHRLFAPQSKPSSQVHIPTNLCFLQVHPSQQDDSTPTSALQFLTSLTTSNTPISFEVVGNANQILCQFTCTESLCRSVESALSVRFPHTSVHQTAEDFLTQSITEQNLCVAEYCLSNFYAYPLQTFKTFKDLDPLTAILGVLEELPNGSVGALQILFQRIPDHWRNQLQKVVEDPYTSSLPVLPDEPRLLKETDLKTAHSFFAVSIRLIASDQSILTRLEGYLNLFDGIDNRLKRVTFTYPQIQIRKMIEGRVTYRSGILLNAAELVGFVHLPSASLISEKLQRTTKQTAPLPSVFQTRSNGIYLGLNHHKGKDSPAHLTQQELLRHIYLIGVSGTGKSTWMLHTALQLIEQGYGIACLDPHADFVQHHLLPRIPTHRQKDVIWFDPSDDEYAIGFNILSAEHEDERELLSEDLISIFQRITPGWGPRLETILAYAILAIVTSKKGGTLQDLRLFLSDESVRLRYLTDHPEKDVQYFWNTEFKNFPQGAISPVLTRLSAFLRRKRIRNIVSQQKTLPLRTIMDTGKILLCPLSIGSLGDSNAYLLGSLLSARIQQTAMMRQDIPESQRRPFILFVDEFHNLLSKSMETILSSTRKYGLALVVAHQGIQQLYGRDRDVAAAVLSNPFTRICFRLGDADARALSDGMGKFGADDLQNLSRGEAIIRLDRSDQVCNIETSPPPPMPENGHIIAQQIIEASRKTYGTSIQELNTQSQNSHTPNMPTQISEKDFYE